ncbi:hypothetical protein G7054_g7591 [Neopestalotiopsis clavispora]|nr:hypothetical protein G7054_g7591 [Neopestalotiopsis clavispora]
MGRTGMQQQAGMPMMPNQMGYMGPGNTNPANMNQTNMNQRNMNQANINQSQANMYPGSMIPGNLNNVRSDSRNNYSHHGLPSHAPEPSESRDANNGTRQVPHRDKSVAPKDEYAWP